MKKFSLKITSRHLSRWEETRTFLSAALLVVLVFGGTSAYYVHATAETLTVTIASSLSFSVTTNQFGTLNPGSPKIATSTLSTTTNNLNGWNVTLSADNKTNSVMAMSQGGLYFITDLSPQYMASSSAATTTPLTGFVSAITEGQDVLAFRVMSASGSTPFRSTSWWGSSDVNYNASQLWAGFSSSTNVSRIGNAGVGSYNSAAHLNTVQYYLDVPASQQTGAYTAPLTYTATANP